MEDKIKEQLDYFEILGIDTFRHTYSECVDKLIQQQLMAQADIKHRDKEAFRLNFKHIAN